MTTPTSPPTLLRIDSSVATDADTSISRRLVDRAAAAFLREHPDGLVVTRDLVATPPPHFDPVAAAARRRDDTLSPQEQAAADLSDALAMELQNADALIIGMPLYNWGPPSTLKAWFDHVVSSPLARDHQTMAPMLHLDPAILVVARGGAYGEDTPRVGWDHATDWAEKSFTAIGVALRTIAVEMTLAPKAPYLAELEHIYHRDLAQAERDLDAAFRFEAAQTGT